MVKRELSDMEQKLFDAINLKNLELVKEIVESSSDSKQIVNCVDSYGSTPLQQAAFKGSVEICKFLLDFGADVNNNEHEHGYTALMFGALSGSCDVCTLLLEAGAKTHKTNSVGKTASEMAAFTGQYHVVSTINNFLSQDDLEHVIIKPDKDRLPRNLIPKLHQLSRTYNVHPVKTMLFLNENQEFLEHKKSLLDVLEDVIDGQMKQKDTNEVMAMKLHVIHRTLRNVFKWMEKEKESNVMKFAKMLLAAPDSPSPKALDLLVRQCIKEFPYQHSVLLQTIVKTLSKVPPGSEPSAVNVMRQSLLGQRMMMDEVFCTTCGEAKAHKRCSACKAVNYCSAECQKLHWFAHKKWCNELGREKSKVSATKGRPMDYHQPHPSATKPSANQRCVKGEGITADEESLISHPAS